ncbi:hypothetical protein RL72_03809 [Microbacterium azadirachtae]|uniref:Uncharacterized protein n=1 Tax=Microbacterium azadirachtae TaxID=582680 RepID=A0A0F0KBJ5_9MICO|nr:hypothetical protein RL72_03809 [Microbacterium azadirachtae]
MLVAVPYFLAANGLKMLIEDGGSAWLSLPLLWCLVMGLAFLLLGPACLALLVRERLRKRVLVVRRDELRAPRRH